MTPVPNIFPTIHRQSVQVAGEKEQKTNRFFQKEAICLGVNIERKLPPLAILAEVIQRRGFFGCRYTIGLHSYFFERKHTNLLCKINFPYVAV